MSSAAANALHVLAQAVRASLDETFAEYALMPFFVRPLVKRGFVKRTGHDADKWRALLDAVARGDRTPDDAAHLGRLADHFDGAPDRARRGRGAKPDELREVERRSARRAAAARALADALRAG